METLIYLLLMHSVWQGLTLAALTGAVLLLTGDAPAYVRYRFLTALLFLFAGSMLVTAISTAQNLSMGINETTSPFTASPDAFGLLAEMWGELTSYLNVYAPYIVWGWVGIVAARGAQMAAALYRTGQLRRVKVYDAGTQWQLRTKTLATQLGLNKGVQTISSGLAKVPVTIGHFKPLILIPVGLINSLPAAEVEAIICHELAHIKRNDYAMNLLQAAMDTLFFFNPAVIWLNRLIRAERELCCDDMALAANVNKRDYISALVGCREHQMDCEYAMAFAGNKQSLLQRVRRITGEQKSGKRSTAPLLLLVMGTVVAALAFSRPNMTNAPDGTRQEYNKTKETVDEPVEQITPVNRNRCSAEPVIGINPVLNTQANLKTETGCEPTTFKALIAPPNTLSCSPAPKCIPAVVNAPGVLRVNEINPCLPEPTACGPVSYKTNTKRTDVAGQDGGKLRTDNVTCGTVNTAVSYIVQKQQCTPVASGAMTNYNK